MTKSVNILFPALAALMAISAAGQGTALVQIEGTVKGSHGVPMRGFVVRLPDGTGSVSNGLGHYTLLVPSGFTGAVGAHNYTNITSDQVNQDITFGQTAQGPIFGGSGFTISTNNGQVISAGGRYDFDVPTDSVLVVTPAAPGVIFNPTSFSFFYTPNPTVAPSFTATSGLQFPLYTAGPIYQGCYPPFFASSFDGSAPHVYAWALLNSIPGDQFYFDWFDPSGLLWMHSAATLDFIGVGCAWALLDTPAAAMHPGTWRVVFGSRDLIRGQSTFALTIDPYLTGTIEGSMAHLAIANGWESNILLINPANIPSKVRLQFGDDNGATLPLAGPGTNATLNPHATLTVSQTGPADAAVQTGSARFDGTGHVNGFIRFRYAPIDQDAIVPLETRAADSYVLAYDSTKGIATGVAVANLAALPATIPVIIRDDTGLTIGTGSLTIPATGHTAFVLSDKFPATGNTTGTVEFQTPQDRRISVIGIRYPPGGRFTTIPVVASNDVGGGSMAHLTVGDGWTTTVELINFGTTFADTHLKFFDDAGNTLQFPLTFGGNSTNTSSVDQTLAPHAHLVVQSNAQPGAPLQEGSAQLTTNGKVSGFIRFRYGPRDQEAIVPIESRNDGSYILAFDNTGSVATGVAVSNQGASAANISAVIRDSTGATITTGVVHVPANGHSAFVLADQFSATANASGTVEFLTPASGPISVLGLRFPASGEFSTIPVVAP